MKVCSIIIVFILSCIIGTLPAQAMVQPKVKHHFVLSHMIKAETIKSLSQLVQQKYVSTTIATKMAHYITNQFKHNAYAHIKNPTRFAAKLTSDLRAIHNDLHLFVIFDPKGAHDLKKTYDKRHISVAAKKQQQAMLKWNNYGFNAVRILPGNIAYIDYRRFVSEAASKNTIAAVMQFVCNANAIIFDLRGNRGGDSKTVQLLCSYLFGNKPVHLNNQYTRYTHTTQQFWTLKQIDGKRMPNVPVFILTSPMTFSGAEEFTYDLQSLKRAVVVGQRTAGGAHAAQVFPINNWFVALLPIHEAINPVTKTNWEGTGVIPNVAVAANKALSVAHILALKKVLALSKNQNVRRETRWILNSLLALKKAPKMSHAQLQRFVGTYGDGNIMSYKRGLLFYKEKGIPENNPIIPISKTDFIYKDLNDRLLNQIKLHFNINKKHQVLGLTKLYEDGQHEYFHKQEAF